MTETVIRPATFEVPTPEPRRYELLDVATVRDGFGWLDPAGLFDTFNCLRPTAVDWTCPPTGAKTYVNGPTWVDGTKFFVYLGGTCKSVGLDQDDMNAQISRVFDLNESFAVEQRFQAAILSGASSVIAGAFSPINALALLEQDAATKYAGTPTIHMSRAIATLLTQQGILERDGTVLRTKLGSKVVAGGGYTSASMWATGEVLLVRSEKNVHPVFNQSTNEVSNLAERAYVASVDCYRAKVDVGAIAPGTQDFPTTPGGPLDTGADTLTGASTWTAPSGKSLRTLTVMVTNGTVLVDGDPVTAPNAVTFDADTGESLTLPTVEATSTTDHAVIYWVANP